MNRETSRKLLHYIFNSAVGVPEEIKTTFI